MHAQQKCLDVMQVRLAAGRPLRDVAGEEEMHRVVAKIRPLLKKGKTADAIMVITHPCLRLSGSDRRRLSRAGVQAIARGYL